MNEAVIVAGLRTAVGKAPRGTLRTTRPDDMAAEVIGSLMRKTPGLAPDAIDDVIRDGHQVALRLSDHVPNHRIAWQYKRRQKNAALAVVPPLVNC